MKYKRKNKAEAIIQTLILVIGIIAFAWMIESEVRVISAVNEEKDCSTFSYCENDILYGGKDSGGTCVKDTSNIIESCAEGCFDTIQCKATMPKPKSDFLEGVTDIVKPIAIGAGTQWTLKQIDKIGFSTKIMPTGDAGAVIAGENAAAAAKEAELLSAGGKTPKGGKGYFKFFKTATGPVAQIVSNAVWAATTAMIISYIANKYASQRNAADLKTVAWVGAGIGTAIATIMAIGAGTGPPGWVAAAITAVFAGVYMLVGYQVYSREVFTFRSGLWQPLSGGLSCDKCNKLKFGCSEYMCHSYGQACDWINTETKYETCVEVNKGDKAPPIITPLKNVYEEDVFPDNTKYNYIVSPAGAKIIYNEDSGKCVPAFTPITLALGTNENANCRISIESIQGTNSKTIFDNMKDMAEGTTFTKNHTLSLPSIVAASQSAMEAAGYKLTSGGKYAFYVRCKDVQGNINSQDYIMSFCVQIGPDTNPPKITGTYPAQNSFVPYDAENIPNFEVYTNKPADCKWDFDKKSYDFMSYTFKTCSQTINEGINGYDLGCKGTLTGIKKGAENEYYIACIDQPELKGTAKENKRNKGAPYKLILKGTNKLIILDATINGKPNETTIKDSIENVNAKIEVETFGGAEEGKARCKYSKDKTEPRMYSLFNNDRSREYLYKNTQNLYLSSGTYEYFIQCTDIAGNLAETMIKFKVEIDNTPPTVVRVYKDNEEDSLKIITNETGECVFFSDADIKCTYLFDEGTKMTTLDGKEHYTPWKTNTDFYIKCRDEYKTPPNLEECSIIVRPFEIFPTQ